jgi:hypothetical protein
LVWQTLAFVARYGHQPLDVMLDMTVPDLHRLADAIGNLLDKESAPTERD